MARGKKKKKTEWNPWMILGILVIAVVAIMLIQGKNPGTEIQTFFAGDAPEPTGDILTYEVETNIQCTSAVNCNPYLEDYGASSASCEEGVCLIKVQVEVP